MSNSQLNQDLNIIKYFNKKKNGYFIEIGANDGVHMSNTYKLEKEYKWDGICIEPIPAIFQNLRNNRKCKCINMAISNESNKSVDFVIKKCHLISGIYKNLDEYVTIDGIKHHRGFNKDLDKIIKVNTIRLDDLLENENAPSLIDYLSLDTEGSELDILKSNNFDKFNFKVIDVEHNFVEPRRTDIRNFLENKKYKFNLENKFDDNYIYTG